MDHAAALLEQNRLLADLVRDTDGATPVPTCPGWTITQLVRHVGRGDRWAAAMVRDRAGSALDPREVPDGKPPADGADAWLRESPRLLLDAVAGNADPVWTFTGPKPAAWWIRRRLHESTVHRADAALALGAPYEIAPAVAADGVSEYLTLVAARPPADPPLLDDGATLHLHATDDGLGAAGEWMIRTVGGRVEWAPGHAKGTTAVRGSSADLLLALLRRRPPGDERLQVLGDAGVLDSWLQRTAF